MPAGTESLPPAARDALDEYLAAPAAALPGAVCGVYVDAAWVAGDRR
jgi:hypothetical protein